MSTHELAEILVAISSLVGAIGSTWATLSSRQNGRDIKDVHHSTNKMKEELVAVVGASRYAEGLAEGKKNGSKE